MPVWTIAGETGKAWDGTAQTLEFRKISGANLTFRSLAVDELVLDIEVEDITTYTAPELGQVVQLYRNGLNFFTGHVTANPVTFSQRSQSLRIVVSGPWWWMERINYTSTQTDGTGATATRMTGVFGDATSGTNLSTALISAINTMRTLGVPISNIVNVAVFFDVPRVTLNQSTCAQVLSELVRLVPDTMVFFDYSFAVPRINVTRRSVAATRTLTIGTDEIESVDVQPIYEMKVEQVDLPFVERDAIGRTKFNLQSSGTATTGRAQIITASGPELDTFLPNDLFERTLIATFDAANYESFALRDSQFAEAIKNGLTTQLFFPVSATQFRGGDSSGLSGGTYVQQTIEGISVVDGTGLPVSTAGRFFALAPSAPQWAIDQFGLIPIKISGRYTYEWIDSRYDAPYTASNFVPGDPLPSWISSLNMTQLDKYYRNIGFNRNGGITLLAGSYTINAYLSPTNYHIEGTARTGSGATQIVLATTASSVDGFYVGVQITWRNQFTDTITAYDGATRTATLTQTWSSAQRPASGNAYALQGHPLYQPADYTFIAPPANLAANLLAAQNFIPYEGSINLTQEVAGAVRYRGCKVNLIGSLPEHATMGALVSEESLNIATGQTTITLGTAPRLDYRTFVDRIRKTPQDNIVFT
jgi:hypothetical protein